MKKLFMLKSSFFVVVLCLFGVLSISSTASAMIFASGDATPAYYAGDNDNNVFFNNILQGGTSVLVHDPINTWIGNNMNTYYNSLAGVNSLLLEDELVTTSLLLGVDFFVTSLDSGGLSASEVDAFDNFLDLGGSLLFMCDYTNPETDINNALAALGSSMMLYEPISDPGNNYATGSSIAPDPFTVGVSTFTYGATYGVSGGTPLFFDSTDRAFLAYEGSAAPVPEPATILLMGTGLLGMMGFGRKKFNKKA